MIQNRIIKEVEHCVQISTLKPLLLHQPGIRPLLNLKEDGIFKTPEAMPARHKLDHVSLLQYPGTEGAFVHGIELNFRPSLPDQEGFRSADEMTLQWQVRMTGNDTLFRVDHKAKLLVIAVRRDKGGFRRHVIASDDSGDMLIVPGDMVD